MLKLIVATSLASCSIVSIAAPAYAQAETEEAVKPDPNIKQLEKLFGGLFSTKDAGPIDPQRLALAQQTTGKIMPSGIYNKMMGDMFDKMLGPLFGDKTGMSDFEISVTTGVDIPENGFDAQKRAAITVLLDPHFADRSALIKESMRPMLDKAMASIEAPMREGLARAYARKFSAEQLTEMNQFFATPTGSFYASESFALQADPEVMQAMFSALPTLMQDMMQPAGDIDKKMKAIPPGKKLSDLKPAEMESLAKLLGTTTSQLKKHAESSMDFAEPAEAADAMPADDAAVDDPFANESGTEPWWDRENWDAADRQQMEELEAKADALQAQSSEATNAFLEFETQAMLRVRERYRANGWKPAASSE